MPGLVAVLTELIGHHYLKVATVVYLINCVAGIDGFSID